MACTINNFLSTEKVLTSAGSKFEKTNLHHRKLIRHLYRRLGYGASLADIENADGKTIDSLVNELIDDAANTPFPEEEFDWIYRDIDFPERSTNGDNVTSISDDTYDKIMIGYWINESIIEGVRGKLILFWHNHFVTGATTHDKTYAMLRYFKILSENAFGDFKVFTKAIGRTPRMLKYLNGDENTVKLLSSPTADPLEYSGPNENYARELLELFTMGIKDKYSKNGEGYGEDNYSPDDINQLGKALTGWKVAQNDFAYEGAQKPQENEFRFQYARHDWSKKAFLESDEYDPNELYWKPITGNTQAPSSTTDGHIIDMAEVADTIDANTSTSSRHITAGDMEYNKAHDIIFTQRADQIAYFICEKLYKFYVYADLDAENLQELTTPPAPGVENIHTYIKELAIQFRDDNWNIANVLKTIFKSQHFYDPGVIGGQIKSHVESAVSFFHTAGLVPSNWAPKADGTASEITNKGNYDYKYRFGLLEPHLHDTPSAECYTLNNGVSTPVTCGIAGSYTNDNYVAGENVNAITGERGTPHEVYKGIFRPHHPARIAAACKDIGQEVLNPPHVAGWAGHRYWLNEYTLIKRRELLESYLTGPAFTEDPTTYYSNTLYGFRLVTKRKFLTIAKKLIDLEYATPDYTDPVQVVEVLWKHFFCVTPTPTQKTVAEAVIPTINVNPTSTAEEEEMALNINELILHFIRQPEYQLT